MAKPWRTDAVMRLLVSVFVCIFAGSLLAALAQQLRGPGFQFAGRSFWLGTAGMGLLGATLFLIHQPWPAEQFLRRATIAGACFYGGIFLGSWALQMAGPTKVSPLQLLIAGLSFQGVALVLVAGFVREHDISWMEAFGLDLEGGRATVLGLLLACIFLPVGWALQWGSAELLNHLPFWKFAAQEQQAVQTLRETSAWGDRFMLAGVTILLAPIAEELLFRGILYPYIKRLGYPRLALWVTSLVFAAMHLNVVTFLPLTVLALMLGALYERTGNLLAPIASHCLFNAFNFTMLYILEQRAG